MIMLVHLTVVTYSDLSGLENKFGRKYYCRRATLVLGGMLSLGTIHEIVIVIPDHRRSSSSTKEERSIDRSQTCEYFENILFFRIICDPSPPSRIASPLFRCFFLFIRFSTISNNTSNNNDDDDEHCERTKDCSVSEKI